MTKEEVLSQLEALYDEKRHRQNVIKNHELKYEVREKWMASENHMVQRAGWNLTSMKVSRKAEDLDYDGLLDRLEKEMPEANELAQWTMNFALANIGIHHEKHRERALQLGEKMGIYSEYPTAKGCTSPYAPIWINEMVSRQTS
jgi:3-methyladenine DNA glycosylase AlkD